MADPIHPLAAEVIARAASAARDPRDGLHCRMRHQHATRQEVMACLPLLENITVAELGGDGGHEYVGWLRSGLGLVLETDPGVPLVDIGW